MALQIIAMVWGYEFGKVFGFIYARFTYILTLPPKCEGHSQLMAHEDEASLDLTTPITRYKRFLHLRHSLNTR